jgi:plasmid maintenance system antidote protein VapI
VNPAHLFAGTHAVNMRDKRRKGRAQRLYGALNGRTVVGAETAVRIFMAYRSGKLTQKQIAKLFGVTRSKVADIVNRRTHRDVTEGL